MLKAIIFIVVSVGIVYLSRIALRDPHSYGFYRLFAFESILILVLLNMERWFHDPFSVFQIISWVMLCFSLLLVVHGFRMLRKIGRPKGGMDDTTILVVQGAYKYIRHPVYCSALLLAWGVFFKDPSFTGGILVLAASAFLTATAKVEERQTLNKFGDEYAQYRNKTKMFIPFLF
jgi:protein-S-isoprenylcysteine O-methyltransferase Ste14